MSEYTQPLAIAILCILALALAAATLASPVDVGGDRGETDGGNSSIDSPAVNGSGDYAGTSWNLTVYENENLCYEPLVETPLWVVMVLAALLVGVVATILSNRYWGVAYGALSLAPVVIAVIILTAGCAGTIPGPPEAQDAASDAGEDVGGVLEGFGPGEEGGTGISTPMLFVGGLLVLTIVGLLVSVVLFQEDTDEEDEQEYGFEHEQAGAIGRVAGEAADEIEASEGLHNDIYWAWAKMASELDVDDPERSTPTEFAEAAREAGVGPDDIEDLTALFEQVRYGTADATTDREQQAIDALRRIERYDADDSVDTDTAETADMGEKE